MLLSASAAWVEGGGCSVSEGTTRDQLVKAVEDAKLIWKCAVQDLHKRLKELNDTQDRLAAFDRQADTQEAKP